MKTFLVLLMATACLCTIPARTISGTIRAADDGSPIPGMLVSDGFSFVETGADGRYELILSPKAELVWFQRTSDNFADEHSFWKPIGDTDDGYDFQTLPAKTPGAGKPFSVLMVSDSETGDLAFSEELRKYAVVHPEVGLVLVAGDMAAGTTKDLRAHLEKLCWEKMGVPVAYVCGNHDIDFRGRGEFGASDPYQALLGPRWYSFELGGRLFVATPIYNSWGASLLYDMKDCGDWVQELCRLFPKTEKVLICHDLPDLVGIRMETHGAPLNLAKEGFATMLYGHKHCNIVRKYGESRRAFCVAPPNKGGAGCFGPSFRVVAFQPDGTPPKSRVFPVDLQEYAHIQLLPGHEVRVTAWNGGDEVTTVAVASVLSLLQAARTGAYSGNEHVFLAKNVSERTWRGTLPDGWNAVSPLAVAAVCASGRVYLRIFQPEEVEKSAKLRWWTELPGGVAMADLRCADGLLIVACSDDDEAENGGLYALDPADGHVVWKYLSGYGIRNNFTIENGAVYAIDTRANIHAVRLADGMPLWRNPSDPSVVSPAANGLICKDGVVIAGYGRHLRGVDAQSGQTLWRNTAWKMEERTPSEDKLVAFDEETFLVISRLNGLYCQEIRTGAVRWLFSKLFLNGTPLARGNDVLLLGNGDTLYRLDHQTGRLLQTIPKISSRSATPAPVPLSDGRLLVSSGDNGVGCYTSDFAAELWHFWPEKALFATGDYIAGHPPAVTATPLPDGNRIWICGNDGGLYRVNPADGSSEKIFSIGMPILNRPCRMGSLLFVSDCAGRVAAVVVGEE